MGSSDVVIDQFSALSHKALLSTANDRRFNHWRAPTWVPGVEHRRLAAYIVRAAYLSNSARQLLDVDRQEQAQHREYGDAGLLVDRIVAGVLGADWSITVDGADAELGEIQLPARPSPSAPGADPIEKRLADFRLAQWEAEAGALLDGWEAAVAAQPVALARQSELRQWAEKVQLPARLDELEHAATGLGDGVAVLWPSGGWPELQVFDPGFYFPELPDDGGVGAFPAAVHLAWEFEADVNGKAEKMIRRISFRLAEILDTKVDTGPGGAPVWVDAEGYATTGPDMQAGETFTADGRIARRMPWQDPTDPPSTVTCLYSDGTWRLADVTSGKVDALSDSAATWKAYNADLGIDFIPVIHVPNTTSTSEHFGRSVIDLVAQVLDDVAQADTDTMSASRFLGKPTIALAGIDAPANGSVVAPGMLYGLGDKGSMNVLDLSAGLAQLMGHGDRLQDRFWQNGRVPGEMVGRIDGDTTSGVHLALKFSPFAQLVGAARMTRGPKLDLLLKMAQRIAMRYGAIPAGPIPRARFTFGPYLPTNKTETVTMVTSALAARAISTQTAVSLLVAAGFPIDDAAAEVDKIRAGDTQSAAQLADATGSEQLAAEWLGLELPGVRAVAAPNIVLPPAPNGQPGAGA